MFTQRFSGLHQHIQTDGCALVAVAAASSTFVPQSIVLPQDVNDIYASALQTGIMEERSMIMDWRAVFELFGLDVAYYGHMASDWEPGEEEFEIVKWVLSIPDDGIDWAHFTFGGETRGHPFFDPWGSAGPGYITSRTVAEGPIESKRGFRVV